MIAMALAASQAAHADETDHGVWTDDSRQISRCSKKKSRIKINMAADLYSHNLGVVARLCDRMGVMYAAPSIEQGLRKQVLFSAAAHYTIALLMPIPGGAAPRIFA